MIGELYKAVYTQLTLPDVEDPEWINLFKLYVNSRIYALEAPPETAFLFAVFVIDQPDVEHFFGGESRQTATLSVDIYGKTESGIATLMQAEGALNDLMDLAELSATGFDRVRVRSISRGGIEFDGSEQYRVRSIFELIASTNGG